MHQCLARRADHDSRAGRWRGSRSFDEAGAGTNHGPEGWPGTGDATARALLEVEATITETGATTNSRFEAPLEARLLKATPLPGPAQFGSPHQSHSTNAARLIFLYKRR